jgi:hypothetical protein
VEAVDFEVKGPTIVRKTDHLWITLPPERVAEAPAGRILKVFSVGHGFFPLTVRTIFGKVKILLEL